MSTLMRTVTRTLAFPAMKSCPSFLSTQVRHISFADSPFSRPPRSFDRIDTFDALNTKGFKAQAKTVLSCANPAGVKQVRSVLQVCVCVSLSVSMREREKFIIRQPPIGEKDDYDSENSWISDGLPSSSRRRSINSTVDTARAIVCV